LGLYHFNGESFWEIEDFCFSYYPQNTLRPPVTFFTLHYWRLFGFIMKKNITRIIPRLIMKTTNIDYHCFFRSFFLFSVWFVLMLNDTTLSFLIPMYSRNMIQHHHHHHHHHHHNINNQLNQQSNRLKHSIDQEYRTDVIKTLLSSSSSSSSDTLSSTLSLSSSVSSRRSWITQSIMNASPVLLFVSSSLSSLPAYADVSSGTSLPQGAQQFARVVRLKNDVLVCIYIIRRIIIISLILKCVIPLVLSLCQKKPSSFDT
jgi:hypothetical protein